MYILLSTWRTTTSTTTTSSSHSIHSTDQQQPSQRQPQPSTPTWRLSRQQPQPSTGGAAADATPAPWSNTAAGQPPFVESTAASTATAAATEALQQQYSSMAAAFKQQGLDAKAIATSAQWFHTGVCVCMLRVSVVVAVVVVALRAWCLLFVCCRFLGGARLAARVVCLQVCCVCGPRLTLPTVFSTPA